MILRSSNVSNGEIVDADNVYVHPDVVNSENVQVGDIIVVVRNGSRSLMQTPKYMIPKAWLLDFGPRIFSTRSPDNVENTTAWSKPSSRQAPRPKREV